MDRAWSFYYMLQVISLINNFKILTIPASAQPLIETLDQVSMIKITNHPFVKEQMKRITDLGLKEQMLNLPTLVKMLIAGLILCSLIFLVWLSKQDYRLVHKAKEAIMWTPVLRSQIQFYLLTSIHIFKYTKTLEV